MISYIKGKLTEKSPTHIIVETGGIGFKISIPLSSYHSIGETGKEYTILTYLHTREDAVELYGFATKEERDLFQLLISVSGIGPRVAQGILSGISVEEFIRAVRNHDFASLTSAPGVGKKTAERLVVELKDKLGEEKGAAGVFEAAPITRSGEEALLALLSLGYRRRRAAEVVEQIVTKRKDLPTEEIIREALRKL